jgi:outer membrane biosynthesis protein TonB
MVDRKMSFTNAMRQSMNKVNETGFLMHFVFLLLISVIPIMLLNFLSTMVPFLFVLKIFLPPFQVGCLASLYIDQFDEFKESDDEQKNETRFEATPVARPQTEETGDKVEEESRQPEQPVPEQTEASDQSETESFPEENVLNEKPDQEADGHRDQEEETGDKVEEEPKQTEQPVSEQVETSDQDATEPLPEDNTLDEKSEETDGHPGQPEEEPDLDSEKDNKDTI